MTIYRQFRVTYRKRLLVYSLLCVALATGNALFWLHKWHEQGVELCFADTMMTGVQPSFLLMLLIPPTLGLVHQLKFILEQPFVICALDNRARLARNLLAALLFIAFRAVMAVSIPSMLMRVICGLVLPTMGTVSIDGEIIGKGISFPRSIGLLLENPIFIDEFTGAKNLSLLCDIKRLVSQAQIGDTLRRVGLNPSDKRPFRKYSLGMKQRLGIAAAIVESPDLILLDEPFNALDESGIKEIRDLLRELRQKGKLIVLTCHDRQQMESLADEIIAMREGRIVNVDKNCHEEV